MPQILRVNVQMNHWPLEVCNLPECALPLVDFVEGMLPNGRQTARICWPVFREAGEFWLDLLTPDPNTGKLVTGPSASPEAH